MALGASRDPRERSSRVEDVLVLAALVVFAAYACTLPFSRDADFARLSEAVAFAAVFGLAAAHLLLHARQGRASDNGWAWIAGALLTFAVADVWRVLDDLLQLPQSDPPVADVLWLVAFPLLIGGVARLVRARVPQRGNAAFVDAALVATGFFALGAAWLSMVLAGAPIVAGEYSVALSTIDLFASLVVLGVAFGAAQAAGWRPPRSVWLLLAGAGVFAVTDALYALQVAQGTYTHGNWVAIGWPLSAVVFSLAAHSRANGRAQGNVRPADQVHSVVPAAMILAALTVLLIDVDGPLHSVATMFALIAVLLSVLRMDAAVRSALALADQLRIARIDPLTGLPNRRAVRALEPDDVKDSAFVAFDLDGLAEVNATFGTSVGDRVLLLVGQRISNAVRSHDLVSRIGGDEFGVLLRNVDPTTAGRIAESLITKLEVEMTVEGHALRVSACAGVSSLAGEGVDIELLITEAENALREAKKIGTGLVRSYSGLTGERSQDRLRLRAEIKEAFRTGARDFVPYFQPITSIADGSILGVEALVRWHKDGVVLAPGHFLPEIERSGAMGDLTAHMVEASLRALREAGLDCPVTVNIAADLVDMSLPKLIRDIAVSTRSTPEQVIIEITEEAIMGNPVLGARVLGKLRRDGFRVLLDDFGTGWSGLSTLRDLAVDGLKIDHSFVSRMTIDAGTANIVRAVAQLAEVLGVLVIYEGVEDMDEVDRYEVPSGGFIQGYALARPMPVDALVQWIAEREAMGIPASPNGFGLPSVTDLRDA